MDPEDRRQFEKDRQDLLDAATAHKIAEEIAHAIRLLAARPLDEPAGAEMRRALARAEDPRVRAAVERLLRSTPRSRKPHLRLVREDPDDQ